MRACGILMPVFSLPGPFGIGRLNTGIRMPHARILEPSLSC